MDRAEADRAVKGLGEALEIANLSLDEGGRCRLSIDGGAVVVDLGHDPASGVIELAAALPAADPVEAQLARLLRANFNWRGTEGATFAIEPESGALVLQRRLTASEVDNGGLTAALEALVAAAASWAGQLSEGGSDPAAPAADEPTPPSFRIIRP